MHPANIDLCVYERVFLALSSNRYYWTVCKDPGRFCINGTRLKLLKIKLWCLKCEHVSLLVQTSAYRSILIIKKYSFHVDRHSTGSLIQTGFYKKKIIIVLFNILVITVNLPSDSETELFVLLENEINMMLRSGPICAAVILSSDL